MSKLIDYYFIFNIFFFIYVKKETSVSYQILQLLTKISSNIASEDSESEITWDTVSTFLLEGEFDKVCTFLWNNSEGNETINEIRHMIMKRMSYCESISILGDSNINKALLSWNQMTKKADQLLA